MTNGIPVIVIELERGRYLLPLEQSAGIRDCNGPSKLPFQIPPWDSMTDWNGSAVTVLNAAELLGDCAMTGDSVLLRLAAPHQALALRIDGRVTMDRVEPDVVEGGAATVKRKTQGQWIDLTKLIARVQLTNQGHK